MKISNRTMLLYTANIQQRCTGPRLSAVKQKISTIVVLKKSYSF